MKLTYKRVLVAVLYLFIFFAVANCTKKTDEIIPPANGGSGNGGNGEDTTTTVPVKPDVTFWLTTADQSTLLQKQSAILGFGTAANNFPTIIVDTTQVYQTIDGFGYCLTDASASLIYGLSADIRDALLKELFGSDSTSIQVSYLRISIGASDLSSTVYSYDDVPSGQTDVSLQNFSLRPDQSQIVPLLKLILAINPDIKVLGSPWSPPVWMKDNSSFIGGSLQTQYYPVYAQYFVKYIQAMKAEGISIDAITPQNEPLHGGNNPSMLMTAAQQTDFIKNHLGPAFQAANITSKIIIYDHNCDRPDYPISVLNDPAAKAFIDGSAFHLYAGDITALSAVRSAHPDKALYFTEQFTSSTGDFGGDLKWHLKNVIIGSMRNWSKNALEWNLANDPNYAMHTPGGCNSCKGALTIGANVSRNVSYFIVAHASKFVPPNSYRIATSNIGSLYNVAFKRPDGKKVLIVENDGSSSQTFNIQFNGRWVSPTLNGGAVGTFIW